uniref:ABC transporter C family member 10-like n=1 Tax=Rhizophora mucronata TaxID=61149 RepID=A0A2P2JAN9_RHIMU
MEFRREVEKNPHCLAFEKVVASVVSGVHLVLGGFHHKPSRKISFKDTIVAVVNSCILICWICLWFVPICCCFMGRSVT